MDHTKKSPTVLSLCTGYGGIEKGLEKAIGKITPVAHVEIEGFADTNLVNKMETKRMVPVPIWTNLKTFHAYAFRDKVDILTGGYPCQPFSAAGKRKGKEDPRHLWPWIREIIKAVRPGLCFFENVEGHISLGLREVLTDLVELGYRVENDCGEPTWGLFSAAEVGAPHQRKRVFILAYSEHAVRWNTEDWLQYPAEWSSCSREIRTAGLISRKLVNPSSHRLQGSSIGATKSQKGNRGKSNSWGTTRGIGQWPARPGQQQYEWEEPRTVADTQDTKWGTRKKTIEECQGRRRNRSTNQSAGILAHTQLSGAPSNRSNVRMWRIKGEQTQGPRRTQAKTQSKLGRPIDGNRDRVDRLRLCGNGVVPDTAEKAFTTLMNRILNPGPTQPSIQLELF